MFVIGITGGTGCGKTTVVNSVIDEMKNDDIVIISQDSYYKDLSHLSYDERVDVNFDDPMAIDFDLMIEHVRALKNQQSIHQPVYSFKAHNRTDDFIATSPKKVLIVEGILVFNNDELRSLFDLKIFIDADSDERLIRRIKRDMRERGRNMDEVLNRYLNTLKPMHQRYIEPAKDLADLIVSNNENNGTAKQTVRTLIETLI